MTAEMLVLRLVHILSGIFWVGSGIFSSFFLMPVLGSVGPAAGPVFAGLARRKLFTMLPLAAILTILSGFRLMQITSANFAPAYFALPMGKTFAWAGVAAIAAFVLGMAIARPAGMKAARLAGAMAGATTDAARADLASQLESARRISAIAGGISIALLILAAAGMAVARYVR